MNEVCLIQKKKKKKKKKGKISLTQDPSIQWQIQEGGRENQGNSGEFRGIQGQ